MNLIQKALKQINISLWEMSTAYKFLFHIYTNDITTILLQS